MANLSKEELLALLSQNNLDLSTVVKGYVDQQDSVIAADVQSKYETLDSKISAITELDDANGVESLAEKIKKLSETLASSGNVDDILNGFVDVDSQLENIASRLSTVETEVAGLKTLSANNKAANENNIAGINALKSRVSSNESDISTLTGDETVEGSVAKTVKDAVTVEKLRAISRENAIETATQTAQTAAQNAQQTANEAKTTAVAADTLSRANKAQIDVLNGGVDTEGSVDYKIAQVTGGDITDLRARVEAEETESTRVKTIIDDTVDGEGNVVSKGLTSKVSDLETEVVATEARAKSYADNKFLSQDMIADIKTNHRCELKNVALGVFGMPLENCDGGEAGGDAGGL